MEMDFQRKGFIYKNVIFHNIENINFHLISNIYYSGRPELIYINQQQINDLWE